MQPGDLETARQLNAVLGPLRRAVLRRTRGAAGLPDLPEAQIAMLRELIAMGSGTPREVAERLRVAQSTVSNLVRAMTTAGLIHRTASEVDLRTAHLTPTDRAADLVARYDRTSSATLDQAIRALRPQHRRALRAAVPALSELLTELEHTDTA
ncbi:MarR family winged helix-turn-helix transcriptional regulator [Nocardia alni]|uniref:MarR family winged helix-turn-helix transcriptional regulator n=1 Tax=Nocardia alni TaxID=2815723 RepID=UPI001C23F40E|nr:MarR family winged helix-turn-helix transcriptional regulator [Nocardia alni]